jgi:hypothetical protein
MQHLEQTVGNLMNGNQLLLKEVNELENDRNSWKCKEMEMMMINQELTNKRNSLRRN